jgi:hypothetical protein
MATIFRAPLVTKREALRRDLELINTPVQNRNLTLLAGQDTFFAGPGMGPEYDYPNPRGKQFPVELRTFIQPMTILLLRPFQTPEQPNPRGRQFPSELRTFVAPVNLNLVGQDQFFTTAGRGPQYDYPNPTRAKSRFAAMTSQPQNNLLETTFTTIAPSTSPFYFARYVIGRGR